jgi:hypothetical protein
VDLLTLIDTPPLATGNKGAEFLMSMEFLFTFALPSIWPYVYDYIDLQIKAAKRATKHKGAWQWFDQTRLLSKPTSTNNGSSGGAQSIRLRPPDLLPLLRIFLTNIQASSAYRPQPYAGPITLLRTGQTFGQTGQSPDLGWRTLAAGGVEISRVPGHHLDVLRSPHVQVLAGQLQRRIEAIASHNGSRK